MNAAAAGLLGLIVAILVLAAATYARWIFTGWTRFGHKGKSPYASPPACPRDEDGNPACADLLPCIAGACYPKDAPAWSVPGKDASKLRFRKVVFTVRPKGGQPRAQDVTENLNAMAVALADGPGAARLTLVRPLNALSFTVPGFNDAAALARDGVKDALVGAEVTLAGEFRAL